MAETPHEQPFDQTPPVVGQGTLVETPAEHKVFPPFDATTFASQLLWFAITFVVFYYVMAKIALPRIAGILEGRRDRIAADLDQAERLKRDSEQAGAAYEKALADARSNASSIASAARDAAKAKADAQRAEVEAGLQKQLTAAEARIADIKTKAIAEVGAIANDTTDALVKALVGVEASAAEVGDAVKAAMAERNVNA
jgi:F-type H+-transporting ATPase subunit b